MILHLVPSAWCTMLLPSRQTHDYTICPHLAVVVVCVVVVAVLLLVVVVLVVMVMVVVVLVPLLLARLWVHIGP